MKRLLLFALATAAVTVPTALAKPVFPDTIALPPGWRPEGIAIGHGTTFYVGSLANGAVYRGDLRTGNGAVLVPGADGRSATGVEFDRDRLFVAGAGTGKGWVFDAKTGAPIREYQLAAGTGATFVNDVAVTKDAAFFTDSSRAVLYRVGLTPSGAPTGAVTALPLTGDFQLVPGFNLNGIEATPNGKALIAVQSATGKLFRIDPGTGATREIDLDGTLFPNGDGLLLEGKQLYVVQNQLNRIAVVALSPDLLRGTLRRAITSPRLDVPTTIVRFGASLYAVNARFSTPPTPTTPYSVVRVPR